ncbi:hypothetical protein F2P56_004024 [Juglans regia]|uniref:Protein FAR1-RELATED SEQUENCE n=2 Tax=Juglans regia TaxID=51240 RepID=A0A833Y4P0_JUGRE|nr:protein FAR1-RELATED SEQUENCE 3-like [Juglans regia]KAF5477376.1 hypothetical protein F2P56_004024 [Juglans regia]
MSSSPSSVNSSVVASSSVQTSASVAASTCLALPAFVPPTSMNPYLCGSEENKVQQSNSIEEISEATSDSIEVEAQSTASLSNTVDTKEASTEGVIPLRSQSQEVNESVRRVLDTNDEVGIQMNKNFHALVTEAGGFENVPFGEKDCRNYIDKARHLRLGKDGTQALFEYFRRMQYKNDGFFSLMELDDDDRLKNVFWADARSRGA